MAQISRLYASQTYCEDLFRAITLAPGIEKLGGKVVLITGAGGLIGSFLVDTLCMASLHAGIDVQVIAAGRNIDKLTSRFAGAPFRNIELTELDVIKPVCLNQDADIIVHAASNAHPSAMIADPKGTILANVLGSSNLIEWGAYHGCKRLLYVSSGEVYGQWDGIKESYDEDYQGYVNPLSLRSCYPLAKRMAENACVSFSADNDIETVVARPCHTYGPCATKSDSRAHAQFLNNALEGRNIVLRSNGDQVRSYNHIVDTVSGLIAVMVSGRNGEAYNLSNPNSICSIAEFADMVAKEGNISVVYERYSEDEMKKQTPITRQVLNSKKLESLGWRGAFSLEAGIKNTLDAMREIGGRLHD